MLIDWFTIVAQLINFVILAVVLKFLLFDRIVEAMEQRREAIAEEKEEAQQRLAEAEENREHLERERRELEANRNEILEGARREVAERRRQLLAEARGAVDQQEKEWQESIRARRQELLATLQRATGEKAVDISRRLLRDLAHQDLEEVAVRHLTDHLDQLPDDRRQAVVEALRSDDSPIVVRTAFELSGEQRHRVISAIREAVDDREREISWERDPELIAGIVIQAGAHTVSWNVDSYLTDLEDELTEVLEVGSASHREEEEEDEAS